MKCRDCIHFEPSSRGYWIGNCNLQLPPWLIRRTSDDGSSLVDDNVVRADDGCDLGKNKEIIDAERR